MHNVILYCADECETTKCAYLQSSESFRGDLACEKCQFPFIYKGVKYENCTSVDQDQYSGYSTGYRYWCSTKTFANGNHVTGYWGYCQDYCAHGNVRNSC